MSGSVAGVFGEARRARRARRVRAGAVSGGLLTVLFTMAGALPAQENSPTTRETAEASEAGQRPRGFLLRTPLVTLGLRAGLNLPRAGSQLFDFTTEQLTLDRSDFNAFTIAGDLGIRLVDRLDVIAGFAYMSTTKASEFRLYEDTDGLPITQRTTFTQVPLTLGLRAYLLPRGREVGRFVWIPTKFAPYVSAGGGMVHYTFRQVGSFVDFVDLSIFDTELESGGWAPLGFASVGADFALGPQVVLNADARYHLANAELRQDFGDFSDGIDLSGFLFSLGVHFRL